MFLIQKHCLCHIKKKFKHSLQLYFLLATLKFILKRMYMFIGIEFYNGDNRLIV